MGMIDRTPVLKLPVVLKLTVLLPSESVMFDVISAGFHVVAGATAEGNAIGPRAENVTGTLSAPGL
jgi:hypothetical protein